MVPLLLAGFRGYSQTISIPDTAFLHALIQAGADTSGDSLISQEEAEAVTELDLSYRAVMDLTGIEAFVNLDEFDCSYTQVPGLDLSQNTLITDLNCSGLGLISLDVSNLPLLEWLACRNNDLTSLDVSGNPQLTGLYIEDNELTFLDVTTNLELTYLRCRANLFTSLDITNNTAIKGLSLDEMPGLHMVCVWELPFPTAEVDLDTTSSPNVVFTTDACPGLGTVSLPAGTFRLYPNPVTNRVTIESKGPYPILLELRDLNGRMIRKARMEGPVQTLDLTGVPGGIYVISVRTVNESIAKRIIKY